MTDEAESAEEEYANFIRHVSHAYFSGNTRPWFEHLANETVYLCNASPTLIGADAVRNHMGLLEGHASRIVDEEYHCKLISKSYACVYGILHIGNNEFVATMKFTVLLKTSGKKPLIVHQHSSYGFESKTGTTGAEGLNMDMRTLNFVGNLLASHKSKRMAFPSGKDTVWLDSNEVLYVQSVGKHTEITCADRIVSCDTPIGELMQGLPGNFYRVHRCYIVNALYVTAIRRCEVELISGMTIPIPQAKYTKVKSELARLM